MKVSPLSQDETEIESWLENQTNPKETYKPLPFDDIKAALQEWLSPEDEDEDIVSESHDDFEDEKTSEPQSNYSLSTKPAAKKSKVEAFDELFDEEDEDDDGMPF